jgi:chorismate-pyruvate lyase
LKFEISEGEDKYKVSKDGPCLAREITTSTEEVIVVSAVTLIREYNDNKVAADVTELS